MVSMTSFEVLPLPSVNELQETSQSPDFIFISDIAIPVVENDLNSATSSESDAAKEELCQRIKTLLDENNVLKEKLIRNNKIMHEQLNIISSWHDQIAASNSKHRSYLEGSVQEISTLKTEKEELSKRVLELEEELRKLKISKFTTTQVAVMEDFDIINDEEVASAMVYQSQDSQTPSKEDLLVQNSLSESKLNQVTKDLEEESFMVSNLMQLLSEKEDQISALKEAENVLKKEHEEKMSVLNQAVLNITSSLEETMNQCKSLEQEIELKDNKLNVFEANVVKLEGNFKLLSEALTDAHSHNRTLEQDLKTAQNKLSQLKAENEDFKTELASRDEEELKNDEVKRKESVVAEQEKLMQLDTMAAQLLSLEMQLEVEKERFEQLNQRFLTTTTDSDTVQLMKLQIEEIKSDFLAEKDARLNAQQETESLREHIKSLETELGSRSPREHGRHHGRHRSPSGHPSEQTLICPKCLFAFSKERAFQNHLNRCLD